MVSSLALYLALVAATGLERLVEVAVSRRNARRAFAAGGFEVGQAHFRVMAVLHATFLASCVAEPVLAERSFPGALGFVALGGVAVAQALRWWAVATLGERWNVRIVVVPGAPPVTSGPYRLVRHPNYVAVVLEIVALPLVHGAWITASAFTLANAAMLFVRIRAEEAALGAPWREVFAARPRFLPLLSFLPFMPRAPETDR